MNPIIARFTDAPWTRRRLVQGLGLGALGLGLPDWLRLQAGAAPARRAKTLIVLWLFGGPRHIDILGNKPHPPPEDPGGFPPAATSGPGTPLCAHPPPRSTGASSGRRRRACPASVCASTCRGRPGTPTASPSSAR